MIFRDNPRAYAIMGCAKRVHATLGFGFLEAAYGDAMEIEFTKVGIPYVREDQVRIYYDGKPLPTVWRADFTCFDREFIVELKAIKTITKIEWAQVVHYLAPRVSRMPCSSTSAGRLCNTTHLIWIDCLLQRRQTPQLPAAKPQPQTSHFKRKAVPWREALAKR